MSRYHNRVWGTVQDIQFLAFVVCLSFLYIDALERIGESQVEVEKNDEVAREGDHEVRRQ